MPTKLSNKVRYSKKSRKKNLERWPLKQSKVTKKKERTEWIERVKYFVELLGAKEFASEAIKATSEYAAHASEVLQEKVPEALEGQSIDFLLQNIIEYRSFYVVFQLEKNSLPRLLKLAKSMVKKPWKKLRNMLSKFMKLAKRKLKNFCEKRRRKSIYKPNNRQQTPSNFCSSS